MREGLARARVRHRRRARRRARRGARGPERVRGPEDGPPVGALGDGRGPVGAGLHVARRVELVVDAELVQQQNAVDDGLHLAEGRELDAQGAPEGLPQLVRAAAGGDDAPRDAPRGFVLVVAAAERGEHLLELARGRRDELERHGHAPDVAVEPQPLVGPPRRRDPAAVAHGRRDDEFG